MRRSVYAAAVVAVAAAVAVPRPLLACAGCRNPNIPQARLGGGALDSGAWLVGATLATSPVRVSHAAGCADPNNCDETVIQPLHSHELAMIPAELRLNAAYSLTTIFGLDLELPMRLVVASASYELPDGTPYEPLDAGIHHRNETLAGIGDIALRGRFVARAGRWWLTTRVGVSIPTGSTEPDPFAAGDAGVAHQHIQFGTGTVDPSLAFDASRSSTRAEFSLYTQGQASLYENRHGFRGPPRLLIGGAGAWKNGTGLLLGGALEASVEGSERWQGVARSDASLGRTELMVGPNVAYTVGKTTLSAMLRAVVYRRIVEGSEDPGTLRAPVVAAVGAAWSFGSR
jgi:hypothetical protein